MNKLVLIAILALIVSLGAVVPSPVSAEFEIPDAHEEYMAKSPAYQVMYNLYDLAKMNAYNGSDEAEYVALEKTSDEALAARVKKGLADGQSAAEAYAAAYSEQAVYLDRVMTWKMAGTDPLAGFYALESSDQDGYLSFVFDDERKVYDVSLVAWSKTDLAKFGRCYGQVDKLQSKFTTSNISNLKIAEDDSRPEVQLEISIENKTATVKTTDAFRKGDYVDVVTAGGEDVFIKSQVILDGQYVLTAK